MTSNGDPNQIDRPSVVDYDREADVLYLNFRRPPVEAEGEMTEDGVIIRRTNGAVVGLTILDASKRG